MFSSSLLSLNLNDTETNWHLLFSKAWHQNACIWHLSAVPIKKLHDLGTCPNSKREHTVSLHETLRSHGPSKQLEPVPNWVPFRDCGLSCIMLILEAKIPNSTSSWSSSHEQWNNIRNCMSFTSFSSGRGKVGNCRAREARTSAQLYHQRLQQFIYLPHGGGGGGDILLASVPFLLIVWHNMYLLFTTFFLERNS